MQLKNLIVVLFYQKINKKLYLTPFAETIQPLVWHLLVTHPDLQKNKTTW